MDLITASKEGNYDLVKRLLANVNPDIQDKWGKTALIWASWCFCSRSTEKDIGVYKDIVELLLGWGADPNIRDNFGWTVIMEASYFGHKDIIEMLLKHKADPNIQEDELGDTAIIRASLDGHKDVVELLLKYGANPNIKNNWGETAIMKASQEGHKDVVELLLKHKLKHCIDPSKVCIWLKKEWILNTLD